MEAVQIVIIAIIVVALVGALALAPRMRRGGSSKSDPELRRRRERVAGAERGDAAQLDQEAAELEQAAALRRDEAEVHEERAGVVEDGLADPELRDGAADAPRSRAGDDRGRTPSPVVEEDFEWTEPERKTSEPFGRTLEDEPVLQPPASEPAEEQPAPEPAGEKPGAMPIEDTPRRRPRAHEGAPAEDVPSVREAGAGRAHEPGVREVSGGRAHEPEPPERKRR